ncbi:TRAP transporter small permease subunit [Ornithinimicrobium avium]|uniref:TRAP transporter small permease n=1 Tax=Ornithinimicrobium avium TaxID=2283195 RepID=A0A345NP80_9MICO|nr:TRAP transporter small permease [Ornithinimicrobium avium]AXH96838.1 TRAP transporter small permease [Ornithinimicrobium avium]
MSAATHHGTAPPYRPPAIVRWVGVLSEASGWLAAIALVLATLITSHGVFVRYFLRQPTVWQTESTIYLLMLVTFVGAAYGLRHHAHVGVDLLIDMVPRRPQLVVRIITALMCLAVVLVVMWTSYLDWHEAYLFNYHSSTAFRFPLWIAFAILPLGMLLVALQYVAMIVEGIMGLAGKVPLDKVSLMTSTSELGQVRSEIELTEELHPQDTARDDGGEPR